MDPFKSVDTSYNNDIKSNNANALFRKFFLGHVDGQKPAKTLGSELPQLRRTSNVRKTLQFLLAAMLPNQRTYSACPNTLPQNTTA